MKTSIHFAAASILLGHRMETNEPLNLKQAWHLVAIEHTKKDRLTFIEKLRTDKTVSNTIAKQLRRFVEAEKGEKE